jgi:hypothetical protein
MEEWNQLPGCWGEWLEETIKEITERKLVVFRSFAIQHYIIGKQYLPAGGAEVKRMK